MVIVLENASEWEYFNKGKANCLYKYVGSEAHFKDKLLRLRLKDQIFTSEEVYNYTEKEIRPKLKETIVIALVEVRFELPDLLNDGFGLLLPNLLPNNFEIVKKEKYFKTYKNGKEFLLELKPKWLSDENDACRNCANYRQKFGFYSEFCSLDLLNEHTQLKALSLITEVLEIQNALLQYFSSQENVLQKLKNLQKTKQIISELRSESDVTDELCAAMTLRDVSVFFIVESNEVKVVVTDTDPKAKSKWKHWVSTEQKSIQNGYYQSSHKHH